MGHLNDPCHLHCAVSCPHHKLWCTWWQDSRYLLEVGLGVPEPDAVDECSQSSTLLQSAPVVAPEVLGQLLGGGGGGDGEGWSGVGERRVVWAGGVGSVVWCGRESEQGRSVLWES